MAIWKYSHYLGPAQLRGVLVFLLAHVVTLTIISNQSKTKTGKLTDGSGSASVTADSVGNLKNNKKTDFYPFIGACKRERQLCYIVAIFCIKGPVVTWF